GFPLDRPDQQDRCGRVVQDLLRDPPEEETAQPAPAVGRQHDQVDAQFLGVLPDSAGDIVRRVGVDMRGRRDAGSLLSVGDGRQVGVGRLDVVQVRFPVNRGGRVMLDDVEERDPGVAGGGEVVGRRQDDLGQPRAVERHQEVSEPLGHRIPPWNVATSRNTYKPTITEATSQATRVVQDWFTRSPIILRSRVKSTSGISAKGIPKLRITWLMHSVRVGSSPSAMTTSAGAMVMARRSQTGMCEFRKPCMMTCPAMVPTVEEESPAASSEMAKTVLASGPSSGVSVR